MNPVEIIGLVAAALSTFSLLPQIVKTFRTRSTEDISWGWLAMSSTGAVLWLTYGLLIASAPLILGNVLTVLFFLSLNVMKYRYRHNVCVVHADES